MPNPKSKYPSVTTVLGPYAGFGAVRPDVMAAACERGGMVHRACLGEASGQFVLVPPSVQGYYDSFRWWFDDHVESVIDVEPLWESHKWQYCGSPDMILIMRGESDPSIWDLKSSKTAGRTWPGQLSAYRQLALENGYERIGRVGSLRLRVDGRPPLADEYTYSDRDFVAFLAALTAWRYFAG